VAPPSPPAGRSLSIRNVLVLHEEFAGVEVDDVYYANVIRIKDQANLHSAAAPAEDVPPMVAQFINDFVQLSGPRHKLGPRHNS
jgi:hypothetical protein